MRGKLSGLILSSILLAGSAHAAIKTQNITYSAPDGTHMEGYMAYDDASPSPRPGILIVHDWMGIGEFTKQKAEQLAQEGYTAFAVDIYGNGAQPANADEAKTISSAYKADRSKLRTHIRAAYDVLTGTPDVNAAKIVVIGYCFGGTTALELARSGAPLAGTVSFHGGLSTPTPQDAKNIKGSVLVLHGADDPMVKLPEVQAFKQEMENARVPLQFIAYPGAVHGFTNPKAGNDNSTGVAYNAEADKASWVAFENFLKQVF